MSFFATQFAALKAAQHAQSAIVSQEAEDTVETPTVIETPEVVVTPAEPVDDLPENPEVAVVEQPVVEEPATESLGGDTHEMIRNRVAAEEGDEEPAATVTDDGEEAGEDESSEDDSEDGEKEGTEEPTEDDDAEDAEPEIVTEEAGELPSQEEDEGEDKGKTPVDDDDTGGDDAASGDEEEDDEDEEEDAEDEDEDDDVNVDQLMQEIENDTLVMSQMSDSYAAIESFGITPTSGAIMQTMGWLDSTALSSIGLEAFQSDGPDSPETAMALEALGETLKAKAAAWGAKIMSVANAVGGKIFAGMKTVYNTVTGGIAKLASGTWDVTKAAGRTIKAHPYKTILAAVVAIGAVAAVAAYVSGGLPMPGASLEAVKTFGKGLVEKINKIKPAFGSVKATLNAATGKVQLHLGMASSAAKAQAFKGLGWTQAMVKSAGSQLARNFSAAATAVKGCAARGVKFAAAAAKGVVSSPAAQKAKDASFAAAKAAGGATAKAAGKVVAAGSKAVDVYKGGIEYAVEKSFDFGMKHGGMTGGIIAMLAMIAIVPRLVAYVIVGGLKLIWKTVKAIASVVAGGSAQAAAA